MQNEISEKLKQVQKASRSLNMIDEHLINKVLAELADLAEGKTDFLLEANSKDLDAMNPDDPKYDRLKLTEERIKNIAADIRNVASLPYPVGRVLSDKKMPNGLNIRKVSVPLGVIGIIYESRPNVTFDVFSLCLKSGNACVLKGSKDAEFSNLAILSLIEKVLQQHQLNTDIVYLMPADRDATMTMLHAVGYIDIVIPHQANQRITDAVASRLGVPDEKVYSNIAEMGNTSSASIPIAMDECIQSGKIREGSLVLLTAFGGGVTWGGTVIRF